jgi:HPr kinase/phosphorylase
MEQSGGLQDQPDLQSPVHASCVAYHGRGLLILGASGAGKSSLALQMIALGAELIADDRVVLTSEGTGLIASCPPALKNMIEARGVGILNVPTGTPTKVHAVVTLDQSETARIPPPREITVLEVRLPLLHKVEIPSFPAALLQYLLGGTQDGSPK